MPDRDKVKKGLEMCSIDFHDACPYDDVRCCISILQKEALDLIQEQEEELERYRHFFQDNCSDPPTEQQSCPPPPKGQETTKAEIEGGGSNWWYVCGECHGAIDRADQYCRHCGRKIKE